MICRAPRGGKIFTKSSQWIGQDGRASVIKGLLARYGRHAGRGALDSTLRFSALQAGEDGRMDIIIPFWADLEACILGT